MLLLTSRHCAHQQHHSAVWAVGWQCCNEQFECLDKTLQWETCNGTSGDELNVETSVVAIGREDACLETELIKGYGKQLESRSKGDINILNG